MSATEEKEEQGVTASAEGDRDALLDAFKPAARQVGKSASGPAAFTALRIRADSTGAVVEASDGRVSVRVPLPLQIGMGDEWEVQVSPRIADVVRAIASGRIKIDMDQGRMQIRGPGRSKYQLPLYTHPWPTINFGDSIDWQKVPSTKGADVLELARASRFASEGVGGRPNLAGVNVRLLEDKTLIAGTDSFRLYTASADEMGVGEEEPITIPTEMIESIAAVFGTGSVKLAADKKSVFAYNDTGARVVARRVDGSFPNPANIVPKEADAKIIVKLDRRFFLDALERLSIFFHASKPVRLTFDQSDLELYVDTDLGEGTEYVGLMSPVAEKLVVGFNPKHLLDGIRQFDSQELELRIISPTRPMVVRGAATESRQFVQSPVRVQ
jgi:DNA polymerase III subunit beta